MNVRMLLAGCSILIAGMAIAKGVNQSPQALIALEHRWVSANQTHDIRVLKAILAENFIDNTYRGTLRTRQQVLSGPRSGAGYLFAGFKGLNVRFFGNTGIVTGIVVYKKKGGNQRARIRFTDVFHYGHGGWQAVSAQETLVAAQ